MGRKKKTLEKGSNKNCLQACKSKCYSLGENNAFFNVVFP